MNYTQEIINRSNAWYNDGLRKAKIRDLSGAIVSLRRSLQYYRGNINARNLLGLVYYGRGEVSDALVEWIICKNFRPGDNPANYFIKKIQYNPEKLEVVNQAIHMYNQSLVICTQDGDDMAIIQLKKAVSDHPDLLRAWQLLALLYMHTEQYTKARQALVKARKIDTASETTMRYIHAMSQIRGAGSRRIRRRRPNTVEYNRGNETIIQPRAKAVVKELSSRVMILNILFGIGIGAAIIWYLIVPAVNQARYERTNLQMIEYSHRIQSLESQVSAQTRALDEYRAHQAPPVVPEVEDVTVGVQESFEIVLMVQEQFELGETSSEVMAENLLRVNRDLLGERGQEMYDILESSIFPMLAYQNLTAGVEALNVNNYLIAIEQLSRAIQMDESTGEGYALLSLGRAYEGINNIENALVHYRRVIELFPYGEISNQARERVDSLAGNRVQESEGENEE
jgi:tetratricopeptide (TPR) repeat protein